MMFAENYKYFGDVIVVPIGLSPEVILKTQSDYNILDNEYVQSNFRHREPFEHKGDFGHLLIIAGSYGKAGAAVLASKAAINTGAGLVTAHLPVKLVDIMQMSVPEVMISVDKHTEYCSGVESIFKYNAIAIGPGYCTKNVSKQLLLQVLKMIKVPLVLDADALNILSEIPDFVDLLPKGTILTPHPKEFERLFGKFDNTYHKLEFMRKTAIDKSIVIVLKGGITAIALPDGRIFFNNCGNPGMATGGSGDVLTGIIGSLLAQKYTPENAAILGVWFHSNAGDLAEMHVSQMALTASDIIDCLGDIFSWYEI
ncbi:MAG: NAD(P)H-hydrate dehydratase [Marinilabiliales bacterium]|nr:MAG: NAD(P)H-hydrate dehydratase [Marinilabiliales bacterium]